ncbi:SulP family inorganic anion transporter [Ovoidimarina sediminis]|uniref:SulP family inorganic anion transporter n=1 Tax=Ovoidimarina sediminis TaxID=3079856 RepID=UPI00290ABCA4|nr:SulP family inorganic anion transporter [Rhodophyticola sp. MJ-SS7]MDU8943819.1 SulP family inorganic anion transporter [Rhodophyticola sp. MJ-SS7]
MRQPKILTTLRTYDASQFGADLVAGVTVAMVALPLSLAIAIASGVDPATGLTTAIVAGFLISALGGSRVQIGGPTGAFIVVVFGVIAEHGYDGLVLATFMAGLILLVAGYFRAGRLIAFVPEAVVNGFTIGIAIIIATSQIKDFLGLSIEDLPADFLGKMPVLWAERGAVNVPALGIALLSLCLIVAFRRAAPRLPGLIVAVALASLLVAAFALNVDTIHSRFGDLPSTLPVPALPEITWPQIVELFPSALVIAFLAGVESLLSAMVADRMIGGQHRPNAELTAQGVANVASSLFGGLPATGAIARTATNIRAGGKTPVAGIVHALTILLVMFLAAPLAGYLAMPALAALLIVTAWNMSEPHKWRDYARSRPADIALLLLTLVLTVLVDLTVAIGVGVAVGLAIRLSRRATVESDWTPPDR